MKTIYTTQKWQNQRDGLPLGELKCWSYFSPLFCGPQYTRLS